MTHIEANSILVLTDHLIDINFSEADLNLKGQRRHHRKYILLYYTSVCLCVQKLCATPLPLNDRRMGVDVQLVGIPSYTCRITFCSAAKMSRNAYGRDRGHESYNTVAAIARVLRVAAQQILFIMTLFYFISSTCSSYKA